MLSILRSGFIELILPIVEFDLSSLFNNTFRFRTLFMCKIENWSLSHRLKAWSRHQSWWQLQWVNDKNSFRFVNSWTLKFLVPALDARTMTDHNGPQRTTTDHSGPRWLIFSMSQNVPQHAFMVDVTQSHSTQLEVWFCKRKRPCKNHLMRCAQKQTLVPLKKNIKQKKKGHNGPQQTTVGIPRNSTTFFLLKT